MLSMFERIWSSIIIDFIVKLSKSKDFVSNISYNSIFVIVERFIKYNKFIFVNEFYLIEDFTDIVIQKIINNYRLLDEFIINRGMTFALQFFIVFIAKFGVNSKFFIIFYF